MPTHIKQQTRIRSLTTDCKVIKTCHKLWRTNYYEIFFIKYYKHQEVLIIERSTCKIRPLFLLLTAKIPKRMRTAHTSLLHHPLHDSSSVHNSFLHTTFQYRAQSAYKISRVKDLRDMLTYFYSVVISNLNHIYRTWVFYIEHINNTPRRL